MRHVLRLAACVLPIALAACSHGEAEHVSFSSSDTARALPPLGPEDVAVTSTDGAVMMAVVGDTVRMQLTDSLRDHVRSEVEHSVAKDSSDGIGGMIARTVGGAVSGAVSGAMGFVVRVPVQDVEDIRYEHGRIMFSTRGTRGDGHISIESRGPHDGNDSSGGRFSEADGRRFVEAVQRRQRARASGTSNQ